MGTAQAKKCKDSTTFGTWLGGDVVAENPDGEDYAVDSGANILLGCTRFLDENYRYTANLSIGYRYQLDNSGDGRNSGWSLEGSVARNWGGLILGAGALTLFKSEVRDFFGTEIKIDPAFGGFVYVGIALSSNFELQLRRHYLSFESEDGTELEGAEYGVFLHRAF